jgi:hypothetical protein
MMPSFMVLLLCCCYSAQVPNADQAADDAITRNIDRLCGSLPSLQDRMLVLVSDDRGFRATLKTFLQRGGAAVLLVTARLPEDWDTEGWHMSLDERVFFLDWDGLLALGEREVVAEWDDGGDDVDWASDNLWAHWP